MKIIIRWNGAASFRAESESGHEIMMDGLPSFGGENKGPCPNYAGS